MKSIQQTLFFMIIACVFLSCKKNSQDVGSDCENNHTTTVTFKNTGSVTLRVEVSTSLTPQFKPISPVVTLDLAPGTSVTKVIQTNRYFFVWSQNCSSSCSMVTYYAKTYVDCSNYEEKQGF